MITSEFARQIRILAIEMVNTANASHIGGVLSMADLIAVLYNETLNIQPASPKWHDRDRFILSKGHCCAGVYAALALRGFFPIDELKSYGQAGSRLMTHISSQVPGVEFSTGSLGHGLSFGCGKAFAARKLQRNWRTFVMLSDGELDEGSNWEAILFAGHHHLSNLVAIVDFNKIQSLGNVSEILELDPLADKFRSFHWKVNEIDGHDINQIRIALSIPRCNQPTVVIAHTIKGKGVSYMENQLKYHYSAPRTTELTETAFRELKNYGFN
jgi:transketolase